VELVASVEKELADQLSDSDEHQSAASRSRSPSAHSVQSQAYSEPEPCSDCLLLDDISATRGYSSECEAWLVDAANDTEDESVQQNDIATFTSLDGSLVTAQHTDADNIDFAQYLVDRNSCFPASAVSQNDAICDIVKQGSH